MTPDCPGGVDAHGERRGVDSQSAGGDFVGVWRRGITGLKRKRRRDGRCVNALWCGRAHAFAVAAARAEGAGVDEVGACDLD